MPPILLRSGGARAFSSRSMDLSLHLLFFVALLALPCFVGGIGVFNLKRKLVGGYGKKASLVDLREHDSRRHGRMLSAVDIVMGGVGVPTMDGLYFAQIDLGTPPESFHVQVDTGSDILWVNCFNCKRCPKKTSLGFELNLYNPSESSTANLVTCEDTFCSSTYGGKMEGCSAGVPCQYSLLYGDGSGTTGFFVTDNFRYNKVSGNLRTVLANASVTFGCGSQQSGELDSSSDAVDGILGFGQSNSSMISQLASSGKVKKKFAHCLDNQNGGGGIFAIGNVVQPKVKTTPLVPKQTHYNVILKGIDVGSKFLKLPTDLFDTSEKTGTIIDSGTTLTYLPEVALRLLMLEITSPGHTIKKSQGFSCYQYTSNVDDGFPDITFHFEGSLTLKVYPHDYLFELEDDLWCVGFQSSASQANEKQYFLLGDLVLSNKLVFYDVENQAIGWTEYNCSSSISVQDDKTGVVYKVGAHNLSSGPRLQVGGAVLLFLLCSMLHCFVH